MVVAVATEGDEEILKHADHVIYIPKVRDAFSAITASVPLQLLARSIAVMRGCDVRPAPKPGKKCYRRMTGFPTAEKYSWKTIWASRVR